MAVSIRNKIPFISVVKPKHPAWPDIMCFLYFVGTTDDLNVAALSHCDDSCLLFLAASAFSTSGSFWLKLIFVFLLLVLQGVECHTLKCFSRPYKQRALTVSLRYELVLDDVT